MSEAIVGELTLWFPITLAPGRQIQADGGQETSFVLDSHPVTIEVDDQRVIFTVKGLHDEDEGLHYLRRLRQGCFWAMLNNGTSFSSESTIYSISLVEDWRSQHGTPREILGKAYPDGVDGMADKDQPHLFPSDASMARYAMGKPSVVVRTPIQQFSEFVQDGARLAPEREPSERIQIALAIFASATYEVSAAPRFLMFITALESLVDPRNKDSLSIHLVDKWQEDLSQAIKNQPSPETAASLMSLKGSLASLKRESIIQGLRRVVEYTTSQTTLRKEDQVDLRALYDARSRLTHDGTLDVDALNTALTAAEKLCRDVLTAALQGGLPPPGEPNAGAG